ncbi:MULTISPECIES: cyanuric acid amidohydrolase [Pseudomonadota]|uniref:Cyanuric acid amidohydrolase n=7 Tax=Bacteria TaxID=2 RepID=CAH_PSESD|nr:MULTISPECIES: cyanuric acid amidohydrolase [Pseudomonadota]P58329.1 RecName: Full=Cyanuric acid amidohydrolase; Short=CAH [Pseudomonas sp. ADP]AAT09440.1 AtzD [Arthrobacter sp. MCMB-436]AAK50331.1 cyanuric acid amidohydrolase [Pseudomonas sp. ADP]AET43038.1 cyanuric acid amidohydrolase [Pseudomonas sp. ADP]KSW21436.1 cyanuric acid amidohydrolase [Pseudomonas sp. ADP]OBP12141.1 cyanuric acid amidohydrolase [Pseudomonas sp. EGD-AKN5]
MYHIDVFRIPCHSPGDTSGLEDLIETGRVAPADIVAVMGKTEGNGCVNDYTREYATAMLAACLGRHLQLPPHEVEKRVAFVMSGGTEGVLSPHHTVFARRPAIDAHRPAGKRLTLGIAFTRDFLPEEIGRHAQITETAGAVKRAMRDAGIASIDDLHFVQVKCPLLTPAKIASARSRGCAPVTTDTYESMGYSRGASALGIALATEEVPSSMLVDESVLNDWSLSSSLASASAGIELEHNVVIAIGMSEQATSELVIAHGVMSDAIDAASVRRTIESLGIRSDDEMDRIVNVFAKAEASPDGVVRGMRHTMLSDSDINSTRHARAVTGAAIASVVGHGMVYVSGGAEHQGPAGGGPFAVIARA